MAEKIHTTTSSISVIYYIFCAITFNICILIRVRCKEPMFERVSVTKLKVMSIEEGAKKYNISLSLAIVVCIILRRIQECMNCN
jgi:hypothetical protein